MADPTISLSVDNQVTGSSTTFTYASGVVTLTGPDTTKVKVGDAIVIAGATNAGNRGHFVVASIVDATNLTYLNASGVSEGGAGTYTITTTRPGQPFNLTLTVDNTSGSYDVQVLDVLPVHTGDMTMSDVTVQGSTAGAGMAQITAGYTNPINTPGRSDGNFNYLPAANVNVPGPVQVAAGNIAYFVCTVVPMAVTKGTTAVSALMAGDAAAVLHVTRTPLDYLVSMIPNIIRNDSGAVLESPPTSVTVTF